MFLSKHQLLKDSFKIAIKDVIQLVLAMKFVNIENPPEMPVRVAHGSILAQNLFTEIFPHRLIILSWWLVVAVKIFKYYFNTLYRIHIK